MTYDASHTPENAQRVCTQELLRILEEASRFEQVLTEYGGSMDAPTFPQYLAGLMEQRGLTAARLGEAALLSRSFAYQLCSGARAPSRDIVLRLAIVLALPVEECQRLLRAAGRGALYPRVERDAAVIFALNRKLSLFDADELLRSLEEVPLL